MNHSQPLISGNLISGNWVIGDFSGGCGIYCYGSNPTISGNTISGNLGVPLTCGLGIYCVLSDPIISDNLISGHSTSAGHGGGILCDGSNPTLTGNTICGNSAYHGGGVWLAYSNPTFSGCTISGNSASGNGGGIYSDVSIPILVNCIIWGNTPVQQIYGYQYGTQINFCDLGGGFFPGVGNINIDPLFVNPAQNDYRLRWYSACIDTGNPDPIYNDPDSTRSDMGAWYYDQTMPVRVLLTPYNAPIQIPAGGGSFQYAIQTTNIGSATLSVTGWCNVTLPSGTIYGPVLGPVTITLGPGQILSRLRTQTIPASAPAGMYHYNAFAVAAGDTSTDSFTFTKLGAGGWDLGAGGWANTGEEFASDVGAHGCAPASGSGATPTTAISPNPFNPPQLSDTGCQIRQFKSVRHRRAASNDFGGRLARGGRTSGGLRWSSPPLGALYSIV